MNQRDARLKDQQEAELIALRSMCRAAAAEIMAHWKAHCDGEGFGPCNLHARLSGKLPPDLYPDHATPEEVERYIKLTAASLKRPKPTAQEESGNASKRGPLESFGEFKSVRLSQREYTDLCVRHGEDRLKAAIEILDGYIASKGKRYANHAAVFKTGSWVWERVAVTKPKNEPGVW
jgi:hypothetical protein